MASALGKRKRVAREELTASSRSPSPSSEFGNSDGEDMQDIFRRAFEAKFKPLDVEPKKIKVEEMAGEEYEEREAEEESDWSGISSSDEDSDKHEVEVFEYTDPRTRAKPTGERATKAEMRKFMSSKPPSLSTPQPAQPSKANSKPKAKEDDDSREALNLKNDLELQRLLRDSHLLSTLSNPSSSASTGTSTPTATGPLRHKSIDLALLSLGAKKSVFAQKNMPMSHRKGILAKAKTREGRRRAEAKEGGIVLEKEVKAKKGSSMKGRDRGVGGPGVGRFKGGTLKLSRRDVADITSGDSGGGGRGSFQGKGKKKRR